MSSDLPVSGSGSSEGGEPVVHRFEEKGGADHGSEEEGGARLLRDKRRQVLTDGKELIAKKEQVTLKKLEESSKASVAWGGSWDSPAVPINTPPPPPPVRFPQLPKSGTARDVVKWSMKCRKIGKQALKDPRIILPTVRKPKDPETTKVVQNPKEKEIVMIAARSIVSVSSIGQDGIKIQQCSGIIFPQQEGKVMVATSSIVVCKMGELLVPLPKLSVRLSDPDRTLLEGKLVFLSCHYDLVLLEVEVPSLVEFAFTRSCPRYPLYGEEVYAIARGEDSNLMVRKGKMEYLNESNFFGRDYYMFLSCEIPEGGTGGCIADLKGTTIGMTFQLSPNPAVLSITTIGICIDMWLQFGRIARPLHGLSLRSVSLLDLQLQDELSSCYGVDAGFIVDNVSFGSAAERLGLECGDVISFDEEREDLLSFVDEYSVAPTLPQLEDYFLNLGRRFLQYPESTFELKLRVCSLLRRSGRRITLPITFCDQTEQASSVRMT